MISCPWQQSSSQRVSEKGLSSQRAILTHNTEEAAISEGKKSEYSQFLESSVMKVSSKRFAFQTIVSWFVMIY